MEILPLYKVIVGLQGCVYKIEEWRRAMQEEMQSLHENNTYELVEWRIAMQEEMKSLHENNTYELVVEKSHARRYAILA